MHEALESKARRNSGVFVSGRPEMFTTDTPLPQFWAGNDILRGQTCCFSCGPMQAAIQMNLCKACRHFQAVRDIKQILEDVGQWR